MRGALEFRPDRSVTAEQDYIDFERLAVEAEEILGSDDYSGEWIDEFQRRGGSPGGARPKIFVRYEGSEWLVKFRAKGDPKRIGEEDIFALAGKVGLDRREAEAILGNMSRIVERDLRR